MHIKAYIFGGVYAMHMYLKSKLHLQNSMLLNSMFEEGSKDFVKESNSPKQIQV